MINIIAEFRRDENRSVVELLCDARADPNQILDIEWSSDLKPCAQYSVTRGADVSRLLLEKQTNHRDEDADDACVVYCYGKVQNMTSCRKVRISQSDEFVDVRGCMDTFDVMTTTEETGYYHDNTTSGMK